MCLQTPSLIIKKNHCQLPPWPRYLSEAISCLSDQSTHMGWLTSPLACSSHQTLINPAQPWQLQDPRGASCPEGGHISVIFPDSSSTKSPPHPHSRWRFNWLVTDLFTDESQPPAHLEADPSAAVDGCRSPYLTSVWVDGFAARVSLGGLPGTG